jgi:threonine dehydrogenase-like Zn-dependent dehydrogenase
MEPPGFGEMTIETRMSAISAGTEMLFFHDMVDKGMVLDTEIDSLDQEFRYPFKYGYSSVGEVSDTGQNLPRALEEQLVFSFHPHESRYNCSLDDVLSIPEDIGPEDAVFMPSMETALSLVMDAHPVMGENIVVLGQGVMGLLVTSLLSRMSPSHLLTVDPIESRRRRSLEMGADESVGTSNGMEETMDHMDLDGVGPDLIVELSGNPEALNTAIRVSGFEGRIVIGSWYGKKRADLVMGERFHRNRLRLISSQVSHIRPSLSGRWDKQRRTSLAWRMIEEIEPSRLITHRFDIGEAQRAYDMIDREKDKLMQVVFTYE